MWFKKNKKIDLSSNNSNVNGSIKDIYGDDYDSLTFATERLIEATNLLFTNKKKEALKLLLSNFKLLEENKENLGYQTFLRDVPVVVNLFAELKQKPRVENFRNYY